MRVTCKCGITQSVPDQYCWSCTAPILMENQAAMFAKIADNEKAGRIKAEEELKAHRDVIKWIASQQDLFFAECSQAEEIVARCSALLTHDR